MTEYSGPSLKVCICNNAAKRVSSGVSGGNSNLDILASIKHTEQVHVNTSCLHKLNSIQNDLIALTTTYRNIHIITNGKKCEHDITSLINLSAKEGIQPEIKPPGKKMSPKSNYKPSLTEIAK